MFLLNVIEIDAPLEILPTSFDCQTALRISSPAKQGSNGSPNGHSPVDNSPTYSAELLRSWLKATVDIQLQEDQAVGPGHGSRASPPKHGSPKHNTSHGSQHKPHAGTDNSPRRGNQSPRGEQSSTISQLQNKGHVLLLMPLATNLVTCKHADLRASAKELMK
jgi:hypothetical protein